MARTPKGSKARLRAYFLAYIGTVLESDELREASGNASEWGRRVRELRTEEGYQILTHNDRSDLTPGQYLLLNPKPVPAFERGISKETRALVIDRNGFTCQMCGAAAGEPHPADPARKDAVAHRPHCGQVHGRKRRSGHRFRNSASRSGARRAGTNSRCLSGSSPSIRGRRQS